jgi:hypothetical protein
MKVSSSGQGVRATIPYAIPIAASAFCNRVTFEAGHIAGWRAFQEFVHAPANPTTSGHPSQWIVLDMFALASLILVARGRPISGNVLATSLCLVAGIAWFGLTG